MQITEAALSILADAADPVKSGDLIAAVMAMTDAVEQSVRNELKVLVASGRITRPAHGYYTLPRPRGDPEPERAHPLALVILPLASVRAASGSGMTPFERELSEYCAIDGPYLRRITGVNPERLVVLVASGTSMVPTIMPGDHLLVAEWRGEPIISHTVYLWRSRYDGIMIKRAILLDDGAVALQGDSEPHPSGRINPTDDAPAWSIIGRVLRVEKPL
jgi:hypothetical protein